MKNLSRKLTISYQYDRMDPYFSRQSDIKANFRFTMWIDAEQNEKFQPFGISINIKPCRQYHIIKHVTEMIWVSHNLINGLKFESL